MPDKDILPNLFRSEYSRIVAVLSRSFGLEYLEIAEDLASETFLLAAETWPYKGVPENPAAWLHIVARNKAINYLNRNNLFRNKISKNLNLNAHQLNEFEIDLSDRYIADSQLQMLFAVCHPAIPEKSQISLALRVLCGFGIEEIANAFVTNNETISKRLQRAREKLRSEKVQIKVPEKRHLKARLETVLRTVYLLFNEGYYSESDNSLIRQELCLEAMNIVYLLLQHDIANTHSTNSLMSLMCFHASRLETRLSEKGEIILYQDQNENLWDTALIEKGFHYLQQASKWKIVSKYYLEASIAYWHTVKNDSREKWESILNLYSLLLKIDYTAVTALNRILALSKVRGTDTALTEARKLDLKESHFYYLVLHELYKEADREKARDSLSQALKLCKTRTEKLFIKKKIENFKG